jgi:tetratricopeptide (TPR) repeat protein
MTKISILFIKMFITGLLPFWVAAQDVQTLLQQGAALEKSFRDQDALLKYGEVLKKDAHNIIALCKVSQLYTVIGKRQDSKEKQKEFYNKGLDHARLAIKYAPGNAEANFSMAICKGRIAQVSSGEEKIKAINEVKAYADKSIHLDPNNFKGYHLLGKWYFEVSDLNTVEKWLVKMMYGSLPKATLDDAIRNYEKSKQLNPNFMLNYLELAKAYVREGQDAKAKKLLLQMQSLPHTTSDDPKIKALGKKMLDDL